MDQSLKEVITQRVERTAEALRKNNMEAVCLSSAEEVVPYIKSRLKAGDTVAAGGSMTLAATGVMSLLASGEYNYLNRDTEGLTPEQRGEIMRKAFFADAHFASANAISEDGEIHEVDGNGNRVAAIIYGPQNVFIVAGYNKIVENAEEAFKRISTYASPANAKRLSCKTPCAVTGKCIDCQSDARICCDYVTLKHQRTKNRICVLLVAEELGY